MPVNLLSNYELINDHFSLFGIKLGFADKMAISIHTFVVAREEFRFCRFCCDQRVRYHTQKLFEQLDIDIKLKFDTEERARYVRIFVRNFR